MKILGCLFVLFGLAKAEKCNTPMEIAVIVDTSDSLSDGNYLQVKKFIKEMGEIFHVSPHASHVSVVQAGGNVQVAIDFKSSKFGRKKFQQNVDAMKNLGGSWSLDRAFGVVKQKIFSREGGVRNFIPHVAIVITNRRQKRVTHSALVEAAKELHDSRVTVYAIGVGGDTSPDELRSMVKEEYQVYQVNTFKDLANLSSNFSRDICVVHSDALNICEVPVDVGFIVDSSGSISLTGYGNIKNFIKGISVFMGFKPDQTHVGVVLYSKIAEVALKFGKHPHLRKLFRSIHNLPHRKDRTRIDLGLQTANTSLFSKEGGMRENVTKIAILLTDGKQTTENVKDLIPLRDAANVLKQRGITIFVVGIGKNIDRGELRQIVDKEDQLIEAKTFAELEDEVVNIATESCRRAVGVVIGFTKRVYNVTENETVVVGIGVTSGQVTTPVIIRLITRTSTAGKDDFLGITKSITFAPEEPGPKSVEIEIIDDLVVEPTEVFTVSLESSAAVTLDQPASVYIADNDKPKVCSTERDDCHSLATCTDTGPGTYECTCREGYSGDGKTCIAVVIDFIKHVYDFKENEKAVVEIGVKSGQITSPVAVVATTKTSSAGGDDFVAKSKRIIFQPEETGSKSIDIDLVDDLQPEPTEFFTVSLDSTAPVTLGKPAFVNIIDNDEPKICGTEKNDCHPLATCTDTGPGTYECTCRDGYSGDGKTCTAVVIDFIKHVYDFKENEKAVVEIGVKSGQITTPVTVVATTKTSSAGGDDFVAASRSITFKPGETGPKSIEIDLVDDPDLEPTELFTVSLNSTAPVTLGERASVKIMDNDDIVVGFTQRVYNVSEHETAVVEIAVTSGPVTMPVTVDVTTFTSTAGNNDFVGVTDSITFQPGESGPKSVKIELIDDLILEPTEVFTVSLTSSPLVTLGHPATVKIIDNDETKCALDIGFLVDSSASMRNCNYKKEKDFLKEIAEYFQMGPEATRTSLVVYSEDATLIKRFNANGTLEEFKEIVDKLELQGGRAYIDKAMHMAASTVFTEESGMRDYGVPKVLVILNDGAQTGVTESAKEIASMLQKSEVRVVVIGVGEADEKQLHQIVSKDGDLIMAETFEKAKKKVAALLKQFCPPHGVNKCNLETLAVDVRIGGCVSRKRVKIGVCRGNCSSGSRFLRRNEFYEVGCSCCQPTTKVAKTVVLHCNMNTTQAFKIKEAKSCNCHSCV